MLKIKYIFFILSILILYHFDQIKLYEKKFKKLEIATSLITIYTDLYDAIGGGYSKPRFSDKIMDYSLNQNNSNICICTIIKDENLYIREFVEYYFLLGIDKIFIYDNNDIKGEKIENILNDYIQNNFVEIIDIRGLLSIQIPVYNYCYRKNKKIYDWIGFIDVDEYLYIENNQTLKKYFYNERFNKCQTIFFNWVMFNDNDLINYENYSLVKRFTNKVLNHTHGKSFVRGNIDNLLITTSSMPGINIFHFCNSNGELIYPKKFGESNFETKPKAFIKHYYTKTAEEFCFKIKKGDIYFHKYHPRYLQSIREKINLFFKLNKKTKEKINILEKCLSDLLNK